MGNSINSLLTYLDTSPTAYHGVSETVKLLSREGFLLLDERDAWDLKPETGYYVLRNGSSLIAFHTGSLSSRSRRFRIITAHTDSPTFRLKEGKFRKKNGLLTMPVEVVGGPIYSTWFDRDLSIAGRILLRKKDSVESVLYKNKERKVLIPNPPIHLNRTVNEGFEYNPQSHMNCIISSPTGIETDSFYDLIARDLDVEAKNILDADLLLWDTQEAAMTSWNGEFFSSGRIDNLAMCHAAIEALRILKSQPSIAVAALFDNEETGSITPQGADSSFLEQILERITLNTGGSREDFMSGCANSFIISADGAHGIHPNFSDMYDEQFTPSLNDGPVIKKNAKWNYATTGETASRFKLLCEKAGVPWQIYINRSDKPTGKTLGPLTASRLGIPAVDVGNPMWSMHSIRETAGVKDHESMIRVFEHHFAEN